MPDIKIQRISYYEAPKANTIIPFRIPEGFECIELLTGGKVFFETDGVTQCYLRGSVFWHQAGEFTIHRNDPNDPYRCIVFHFQGTGPQRPAPRVSLWKTPDAPVEFAQECMNAFHGGGVDPDLLSNYAYNTLLWNARKRASDTILPPVLKQILRFMETNSAKPLTAGEIAHRGNISRPYLFALFRDYLKTSPHQYLLKQRIARAKLLLANDNIPIKELSAACGFESPEVFYRHFKREVQCTPAEYRRNYSPYGF